MFIKHMKGVYGTVRSVLERSFAPRLLGAVRTDLHKGAVNLYGLVRFVRLWPDLRNQTIRDRR